MTPMPQLRDIHDIQSVPWWPLAPGWWLLGLALLLFAFAVWHWRAALSLRLPIPGLALGTWRWGAFGALRDLQRRARAGQDARTTAGELSELLRRIAMARFGRPACAGLTGNDWLDWLEAHDPHGFPWRERGRMLLDAPYAPFSQIDEAQLRALIDAVASWVTTRETTAIRFRRFRSRTAHSRTSSGV